MSIQGRGARVEKRGVLFDMDGVLIDTGELHRLSWYALAEAEDFEMTDEIFYGTFGMQNHEILPLLVPGILPEELQRMARWKEAKYRELAHDRLTLLPGAEKLLQGLKEASFSLAIGTSTPKVNLDFVLEKLPMRQYFDGFVTGEEVVNSKPAPDTFLKAAEKLGLPSHRCIVVEDALQGVQAGKAALMRVVAVTTTRSREDLQQASPDRIVDSLEELEAQDFLKLLETSPGSSLVSG